MESFQERTLMYNYLNIKKHIFSFWYGCFFKAIYKEIDEWVFELI